MDVEKDTAQFSDLAADILRRHDNREPEANITSAVRDFLINSGLVRAEEVQEENPPSQGSRQAVDLRALDTFIEFKRRVGSSGITPNPEYVQQLDEYLVQSATEGRGVRMGILTDGKHWLLRWPGAGAVRTTRPYAFILESPDSGADLFKWLRDEALAATQQTQPNEQSIKARFGPDSLLYQRDIDTLRQLYQSAANSETIAVKRRLWHNLLMAALGEIARGRDQMDDLFVRHTYLSMTIGMVVQASFGIDIAEVAESEPTALLNGHRFHNATGLQGIVESDFFAWPAEVEGGMSLVKTLARRVARFEWSNAPADVGAILYETVIPPDERRQLGEYYTPDWLARVMVRELVADPLNQRCARSGLRLRHIPCGSGRAFPGGGSPGQADSPSSYRKSAGSGDRHRRASGGRALGPRRVDLGGATGNRGRRQRRIQRPHLSAGLPRRRAATALPHRRSLCRARGDHRGGGRRKHDVGLSREPGGARRYV